MPITKIKTDETLRSVLKYGCSDFPFACYLDKFSNLENKNIIWHWHREFEISYVIEGTVRCFIDDECISLSSGDALFINSELIHHFESNNGIMYNIVFSPELIAGNNATIFHNNVSPYLESDCKYLIFPRENTANFDILNEIKELAVLSRTVTANRELKLFSKVINLWVQIVEISMEKLNPKNKNADMLRQARLRMMMQYIHTNYPLHITLSEIANQANVSVSEALRCFRTGLKTTPINYLTEYRLETAFSQLVSTHSTVHQIAASVGFENASYFCRKFKDKYGYTPMQIRRQNSSLSSSSIHNEKSLSK